MMNPSLEIILGEKFLSVVSGISLAEGSHRI